MGTVPRREEYNCKQTVKYKQANLKKKKYKPEHSQTEQAPSNKPLKLLTITSMHNILIL